jgi:hypothetical protein
MTNRLWTLVLMVLCTAFVLAQEGGGPSPYPGGSPFPPGKEPSLTHVVEAFWTTTDDIETRISIQAKGDRPTQLNCVKVNGEERETIASSIAPDCAYDIRIKSVKGKTDSWYAKGYGNLTVRVYGFNREDFDTPPIVLVQYLKEDKLIGKTEVLAKPVPVKFSTYKKDNG